MAPTSLPAPAAPAPQRPVFTCFDGLRAVAAGSIVVFHVAFLSGIGLRHPRLGLFLARLDVGVPMFFVISGFLLYRPFVAAHLDGVRPPKVRRYLTRRLLRIGPAYWVVLAAVALLGLKTLGHAGDVAVYALFLQIYDTHHLGGGISQAWSLCTEVSFYLALPVWAWTVRRMAAQRPVSQPSTAPSRRALVEAAGVAVLFTTGLVVRAAVAFGGLHRPADDRLDWLPATLDLFAVGMALALISAWEERHPAGRVARAAGMVAGRLWLCWVGAGLAFVAVSAGVFHTTDLGRSFDASQVMGRQVLYGLIGLAAVAPAAIGSPQRRSGPGRTILRSKPVVAVGVASYSVYLTHNAVIDAYLRTTGVRPLHTSFPALLGATIAGTAVVSAVLYLAVERPALRVRRSRTAAAGDPDRRLALAGR